MSGNPNLSPEINAAIAKSDRDGGIQLDHLFDDEVLIVQTLNTKYEIIKGVERNEYVIKGSPKYCPDWKLCRIPGSTFGGSMIKVGFVGIGMRLEVCLMEEQKTIRTSTIQEAYIQKGTVQ